MVSFDTELFGHWWFEGINWIKEVIRKLHNYTAVTMQTASEYLAEHPPAQAIELPESSWGAGGHWQVWLNKETQWMWPVIHRSEQTMQQLAEKYQFQTGALAQRALKQAARELILLESSDWPFLVTTGQARQYAIERFQGHQSRFEQLANMLQSGNFDEQTIREFEEIDNCFPEIDSSYFLPAAVPETRQPAHHI
jgi:1,4-alpha-glucan branching enzyme